MNCKQLLGIFFLLFFAGNAFAQIPSQTYTDNFNTYENNYLILNDTNYPSGWTAANDANTPSTVNGFISSYAQFVPIDVSKAGGNTGGISRTLDQNFDLPDWNTAGARLYMFVKLDSNSNTIRAEIRLGNSSANYFEYRNTDPFEQGWYMGHQLVSFDLNSPAATAGTPSLNDINFLQMNIVYGAPQGDFNVTFNRVWLERQPNSFNNTWKILDVSGTPDGWAMPFTYPIEGSGMIITDTNDPSLGNHGRVFYPEFDSIDTSKFNFDITVDVNQVDTNWGTRILFDATNFSPSDNFSACFIFDATSTSRRIGVEQWINGTRTFSQSTATFAYNTYQTIRCKVTGTAIQIYVNGTLTHTGSVPSRVDGRIGIESFGGRTHIQELSIIKSELLSGVGANNDLFIFMRNTFFAIMLLAFAALFVLGSITSGNLMGIPVGIILIYIAYEVFTKLFFT